MTKEQLTELQAAKNQLFLYALLYARIATERDDSSTVEHKLCYAAKQFTDTVNSIDPTLWQPPCEAPKEKY